MNLGLKGLNKIQCSVSQVMFGGRPDIFPRKLFVVPQD